MKRNVTDYFQIGYETLINNMSIIIYVGVFIFISAILINFARGITDFILNLISSYFYKNSNTLYTISNFFKIIILSAIYFISIFINFYLLYGSLSYLLSFIKGEKLDYNIIFTAGLSNLLNIIIISFFSSIISVLTLGIASFILPLAFLHNIYFLSPGFTSFSKVISKIFEDSSNIISYLLFGLIYIVIYVFSTACCSVLTVFTLPILLTAATYLFLDIFDIDIEVKSKENDQLPDLPV